MREAEVWSNTSAYKRRIARAREIVAEASQLVPLGRALVVSTSWGKDSTVMLHLALEVLREPLLCRVIAAHIASPVELSGGEHVSQWFAERYSDRLEIVNIPPRYSVEEYVDRLRAIGGTWVERNAFGTEVTTSTQSQGRKAKVELADEWLRETGHPVQCLGIRCEESVVRRMVAGKYGPILHKASGWANCYPIIYLRTEDIWAYIWQHRLPYHRLYDCETHGWTRRTLRNGGYLTLPCAEKVPWLRKHFPEEWAKLRRDFPTVALFT